MRMVIGEKQYQLLANIKDEKVTRQRQRAFSRSMAKEDGYHEDHGKKVGPGRRMKWLMRHPKLAPFYILAFNVMSTGERAEQPKWKAVRKMMVILATAPRVPHPVLGRVPYIIAKYRHERPSWRSFPHQTINANLQVEQ